MRGYLPWFRFGPVRRYAFGRGSQHSIDEPTAAAESLRRQCCPTAGLPTSQAKHDSEDGAAAAAGGAAAAPNVAALLEIQPATSSAARPLRVAAGTTRSAYFAEGAMIES
mmetsp:Transcript_168776/g.542441  ORF Transcript_168776/g.542441 Transcript_168776/m.542441 type:complete len:110 (-) Transcript_168776:706-1035(-)